MEDASQALVQMDYLECEAQALRALALAEVERDWPYFARILLPLQEARRQRRISAGEGVLRLGTATLTDAPADWLEQLEPAGCLVVTPPHTTNDAALLETQARRARLPVEVLYAQPRGDVWTLQTHAALQVQVDVPAPPAEALERWVGPAEQRAQPALARWIMRALESLGDAAMAHALGHLPPGDPHPQLTALLTALDAVTDHELLHQRLAAAAHALMQPPTAG